MKKRLLISAIALMLLAGAAMTGCKKEMKEVSTYHPIGNTKRDTLRIYNLLTDLADPYSAAQYGYLMYVDDSLQPFEGNGLIPNIHSYGVPQVVSVPAEGGRVNVKLIKYMNSSYNTTVPPPPRKYSDTLQLIMERTISLPPHTGVGNLLFFDSSGVPAMRYMPVTSADPGAPDKGKFKIRVVNFAYEMPDDYNYGGSLLNSAGPKYHLQLQLADSTVIKGYEDLGFSAAGDYKQYDYGTWQFLVYNLTTNNYVTNSGALNDMAAVFDYSPLPLDPAYGYTNFLFPAINRSFFNSQSTLQYGNRSSYPFAAGGCYTILVLGNIYAVSLDRLYGSGELDDLGKIQVVNANPGQQDLQVTITSTGGKTEIASVPFGSATEPLIFPTGPVTCTFSSKGQTIYTYNTDATRLSNISLFFTEDLNHVPFIFPVNNVITALDFINNGIYSPLIRELNKATFLNLCPDAGNIYITAEGGIYAGGSEFTIVNDLAYKATSGLFTADGYTPPSKYNARLSNSQPDTLAGQKVTTITKPFSRIPAPGTFMLVAAGLLNTQDATRAVKLFIVQQSNFIPKAQ